MIALAMSFAMWVERERAAAEDGARTTTQHSSRLLGSALDAEFGGIDKVLAGLDVAYGVLGDRNLAMLDVLRRQVPLAPIARALLVIGPDGRTRYATNLGDPFAVVDLADRDYVRAHAAAGSGTFLSAPLKSRNDGSWIVVVSRAMRASDGSLRGVAAATVSVEALLGLVEAASPNPNATAVIIDRAGFVLARSPDNAAHVGRSIADSPAFQHMQAEKSGNGTVVSSLDGEERIYGFTACDGFPLVAVVTVSQREMLAQWRGRAVLPGVLLLVLAAIVIALVVNLLRQLRALEVVHEQLHLARIAADSANFAKSSFLANTSHELRTPLNAILGFTDALLHGLPGHCCQSRCQEYLGIVLGSGRHLLSIINDLLDLAKVEAGRLELMREQVDVAAIVGETLAMEAEQARGKGLTMTGEGTDRPATMVGDSLRLRQIFLNLVSNAIKFTPTGGRVDVRVIVSAGEVRVVVADTGIGMTEAELAIARTPFGQVSSDLARAHSGTGLGLPLADQMVTLHGGVMEILSRKGEGTTVAVVLPRG